MAKREYILILIIAVLAFFNWKSCSGPDDGFEKLYLAASDSLHKTVNKLGQEKATTALLYGSVSDFKKLHADDSSAIGKLQNMVDRLTISVSYLSTSTGNTIASATDAVIIHDTVVGPDGVSYVYPEYRDTVINKWENFIMSATRDSFRLNYKVFNEFELKQSWQRQGLLKRKKPIAEITNLNPHTTTKEYKTFTVQENTGNRLRDGLIGAAAGALLVTGLQVFNVQIPIRLRAR